MMMEQQKRALVAKSLIFRLNTSIVQTLKFRKMITVGSSA